MATSGSTGHPVNKVHALKRLEAARWVFVEEVTLRQIQSDFVNENTLSIAGKRASYSEILVLKRWAKLQELIETGKDGHITAPLPGEPPRFARFEIRRRPGRLVGVDFTPEGLGQELTCKLQILVRERYGTIPETIDPNQ